MNRLVRFDWGIHKIFNRNANVIILEGFLSELLKEDVFIIEILEEESNRKSLIDRQNRVDILVKDSNGEDYFVEILQHDERDYFQRLVYLRSKINVEKSEEVNIKGNIKKIISVNLLYFDLGNGDDYIYQGKTEFEGLHTGNALKLSDEEKGIFFKEKVYDLSPKYYIVKVKNFDNIVKNSLDEWIYFLNKNDIKESFSAKGLQKANEEFNLMRFNKTELSNYEDYLHWSRVRRSEISTALQKGYDEGLQTAWIRKVIERLIAVDVPKIQIAAITGSSLEYIDSLNFQMC